jgi:hypothetical protein
LGSLVLQCQVIKENASQNLTGIFYGFLLLGLIYR